MTLTKRQDRGLAALFYLLIITTVFFPFKNYVSAKKYFYINSSLPLFILYLLLGALLYIGYRRKSQAPAFTRTFSVLLLVYAVTFFGNCFFFNHWYNELINKGCSFLFFLMLFTCIDPDFFERNRIWHCILLVFFLLCVAGIVFYFAGYDTLSVKNNAFAYKLLEHGHYPDKRLTFTLPHKSALGLMLFTMEAFVLTRIKREHDRKQNYLLIPFVFLIAFTTILVNSVATTISLALLLAGFLVSLIPFKKLFQTHRSLMLVSLLLIGFAGLAIFVGAFLYASQTRDITTMGSRFPIWKSTLSLIKAYPMGVGDLFQTKKIQIMEGYVNNGHNVFLNDMLRFSIPVGLLFFALFLVIMLFTLLKSSTFSLAFWIGTMIILNIDYSLRSDLMPLYFLMLYYIFFETPKAAKAPA